MTTDHQTEAECLIQLGFIYPARIGLRPRGGGETVLAGFKRGGFSLYFGDAPIYHFDLEGRWQRAFIEGRHFLKGLDGAIHALDRVRDEGGLTLERARIDGVSAADLDEWVRDTARALAKRLAGGAHDRIEPPAARSKPLSNQTLLDFLERIAGWDSAAWSAHRARYAACCRHDDLLPPDCVAAVVVEATRGSAPWVADDQEFETILRDVQAVWGRRLFQPRLIYLAGQGLLKQPIDLIVSRLESTARVFPIRPKTRDEPLVDPLDPARTPHFEGVHAFFDDFSEPRPRDDDWARLAALGLSRVSLGAWSGAPEVRAAGGGFWTNDDLRAVVAGLKAAGMGASVLVRAGAEVAADAHRRQTAALLASLPLSRGDFVFLIDERELENPSPSAPIPDPDRPRLETALRESLVFLKRRGVKVLPYTFQKRRV